MNKLLIALIGVFFAATVIIDAFPKSRRQFLPYKPGYVPVYIRNGDTPLEEINLELAEAFHAIPSGRSAGGIGNMKTPRLENGKEIKEKSTQDGENDAPFEYFKTDDDVKEIKNKNNKKKVQSQIEKEAEKVPGQPVPE